MGLFDDALDELRRRAAKDSKPIGLPFPRLAKVLGGGLWPGQHLIAGPNAAGKTQLLLSIALHAARSNESTTLVMPSDRSVETAARLCGLVEQRSWSARLTGTDASPVDFSAVDDLPISTNRTDDDARIVLSDGGALPRRRPHQAVVTTASIALPGSPRSLIDHAPNTLLDLLQNSDAARTADVVMVLLPLGPARPDSWTSVRLAVAKVRHGVPAWIDLRFNGTWFEEDDDELELSLT